MRTFYSKYTRALTFQNFASSRWRGAAMTPNFVTLTGKELGSVTLKRVGLFCFPIKHSTHTHSIDGTLKIPINRPPIHTRVNRYREHVTHVNKRNTEFAHTCLREQHTLCTFLVNAGLFAPLKTGPPLASRCAHL
jgi:hypothetical protein